MPFTPTNIWLLSVTWMATSSALCLKHDNQADALINAPFLRRLFNTNWRRWRLRSAWAEPSSTTACSCTPRNAWTPPRPPWPNTGENIFLYLLIWSQKQTALLIFVDVLLSFLQGDWPPGQAGHPVPAAPRRLGLHVGIPHRQVCYREWRDNFSEGFKRTSLCCCWTRVSVFSRSFVDSRVQSIYGGTNEIMKELIARSIVSQKWDTWMFSRWRGTWGKWAGLHKWLLAES